MAKRSKTTVLPRPTDYHDKAMEGDPVGLLRHLTDLQGQIDDLAFFATFPEEIQLRLKNMEGELRRFIQFLEGWNSAMRSQAKGK